MLEATIFSVALAASSPIVRSTHQPAIVPQARSMGGDLPLNFHPAAIRASAVDTPLGAV